MITLRLTTLACAIAIAASAPVFAQPTLSASSTNVSPGHAVSFTITGTAGQYFALVGSTVGAGMSYAGVALSVGTDVQILSSGVIGAGGTAVVGFVPPFQGTTLDRYYLQAVTSPSAGFSPLQASAGVIVVNRDLLPPAPIKGSNAGTVSATLVAGSNYVPATAPFVAPANMTCLVTTSVQIDPVNAVPIGSDYAFVRNAVWRDGTPSQDIVWGQYVTSNGLITRQPPLTRSSVMAVGAGESVRFGAYLAGVVGNGVGAAANVQTSYFCS